MVDVNYIKIGDRFIYGGIEWVKLDNAFGGSLSLSVKVLFNMAFDSGRTKNWRYSTLRKALMCGIETGVYANDSLKGINSNDLIRFQRNFQVDNRPCPKKYDYSHDVSLDSISLLSVEEFERYKDIIPKVKNSHWTIDAVDKWFGLREVSFIAYDKTISHIKPYSTNIGVRPLIVLNRYVKVEEV